MLPENLKSVDFSLDKKKPTILQEVLGGVSPYLPYNTRTHCVLDATRTTYKTPHSLYLVGCAFIIHNKLRDFNP
jgi:hypothetical protein